MSEDKNDILNTETAIEEKLQGTACPQNSCTHDSCDTQDTADTTDTTENSENTSEDSTYCSECDFASELENYLPTPENTDKIKKPVPQWVFSAGISAAVCTLLFGIYSVTITPHLKPSAVISYVQSENSGGKIKNTDGISNVAEKLSKSIVSVSGMSSYRSFFGLSSSTNVGSGIIISPNGYILTSNTLAGDGSTVTVTLPDKQEYEAKLIGNDTSKDIAVLKIDAQNLPAASLADSDSVRAGDVSIVMGNLLGSEMGVSVTQGIVCGVNKNISLQNGGTINLLQTDAITSSNSAGGCLLNANGDIIGMITNAINANTDSISFAIPSNDIKNVTQSLIDTGSYPKSGSLIIGITGTDNEHGVVIDKVADDTPAKKSGLKEGDLILKIDGTPVKSIAEINKIRDTHSSGDTIVITIYRDGDITDVNVVL